MVRNKNLPLTETVYYILLAVKEPAHGYLIMQKVEELSGGHVRMAAGTLYGAVENLLKLKLIKPHGIADQRRKVYVLTEEGENVLRQDYDRMKHMLAVTESVFEGRTGMQE